nr:unnamed protein product [Digitaria exilis]
MFVLEINGMRHPWVLHPHRRWQLQSFPRSRVTFLVSSLLRTGHFSAYGKKNSNFFNRRVNAVVSSSAALLLGSRQPSSPANLKIHTPPPPPPPRLGASECDSPPLAAMEAASSALPWWLATAACSPPPAPGTSSIAGRLAFLFLSPCPQRALLAAVDILFLLAAGTLALRARLSRRAARHDGGSGGLAREPLLAKSEDQALPPSVRRGRSATHGLALAAEAVQAAAAVVLLVLALLGLRGRRASAWLAAECAFLAAHAVAHLAAAGVVAAEKKHETAEHARVTQAHHPVHLRIFWLGTAAFAALFSGCAAARYAAGDPILPDDPLAFAWLALSLALFYFSVTGSTGLAAVDAAANGVPSDGDQAAAAAEVTYATASWVSLATFAWINPLISKGSMATLTFDQVPPVAPADTAEASYALFVSNWPAPGASKAEHPVVTALLGSFCPQFLLTAVLGLAHLSVMYIGPSLVGRFVEFVHRGGEVTEGLQLVTILLVGKAAETLVSHHYEFQGQKLGMRINAALLAAVYRKSLWLSTGARRAHGAGTIVNYMEVDAQEVADVAHQLHDLWLMPLQIAVALALLYAHLGPAVLTAVAAIAVVTVVVAFANKLNIEYQFKFLGKRMGGDVQKQDQEELGWLAKSMYFMCANTIVLWSGPLAMTVLVLGTCVLTGVELSAGKVFTATAFFQMLDGPMQSFPESIAAVTQATVSVGRLDRYLLDAELDDSAVQHVEDTGTGTDVVVEVHDGVFAWDMRGNKQNEEVDDGDEEGESEEEKDMEATPVLETVLKGINIEVRRGELAVVVGTVGSGKSSLLSCIMGEMEKISGMVSVCGSTAYVAQTAWMQNGTMQENILFGKPMHAERYKEIIRSCCLQKDLEIMEFGDQTEIGERGINLSGGQKQRIQLARAIYQNCDIYLLDDVFSAVDAHTGSNIFKDCLRGTLKGKTIILVTNQVDFLHNVDNIFVVRDGMIAQSGKYVELLQAGSDFAALVAAHDSSMEMVEQSRQVEKVEHSQLAAVGRIPSLRSRSIGKGEKVFVAPEIDAATSRIIQEEERESGQASSDQTTIDVALAFFIGLTISMYISVLSTIIVTCQVAWPSVIAVIPLLLLNIWYRNRYLATSRELTRLEGVTKAPVIDHFSETVRYRPNTPLILKGININISGGEKIGVVGRTGSGKSTLVQALFRLVEPAEGKMIIDGIDICTLGLHDLRSRFGIIPQEPVLFEGTIRSNIDPIGQYSEAKIWQALERCQLKDVVVSKPEKLDAPGMLFLCFSLYLLA